MVVLKQISMGKTDVRFRCTDGFKDNLEQWAEERGLNMSEYLREAARYYERNTEPDEQDQ